MTNIFKNKDGNWSKVKIGSTLVGVSVIFGTIAALYQGDISTAMFFQQLVTELGVLAGVFGLRDLPFINKSK
jgi:hypothetical protein